MPISLKHKFKFIHIPRCGGSGVEALFGINLQENPNEFYVPKYTHEFSGTRFAPQHFTHRMLDTFLSEDQQKWFSFTVVRNPYYRIISEYYYTHEYFYSKPIHTFDEDHFKWWVWNEVPRFDIDHKLLQSTFIDKPVDVILKLENLTKDFKQINNHLNTNLKIIKTNSNNRSNTKKIVSSLSQDTLDLIYHVFKQDFITFNYPKL